MSMPLEHLRTGPEGNHDDVAATLWPVHLMGFRLNPDVRVASGTVAVPVSGSQAPHPFVSAGKAPACGRTSPICREGSVPSHMEAHQRRSTLTEAPL